MSVPLHTTGTININSARISITPDATVFDSKYEHRIKHHEKLVAPSERCSSLYNEYLKKKKKLSDDSIFPTHNSSKKDRIMIDNLIRKCNVVEDPLQHWLDYIDYLKKVNKACQNQRQNKVPSKLAQLNSKHRCNSASSNNSLFLVMKRCTFALFNHPKYRNDSRFIRVIVLYADQLDDPHDTESLFWHYYKQRVGTQTAVFWISFAFVMEKHFDYKEANRIYIRAINLKAQPVEIIMKRFRGFRQRVKYYGIDIGDGTNTELLKENLEPKVVSQCGDCDGDGDENSCVSRRGRNNHSDVSNKTNDHTNQEMRAQQTKQVIRQKIIDEQNHSKNYSTKEKSQGFSQFPTISSHLNSASSKAKFIIYEDFENKITSFDKEQTALSRTPYNTLQEINERNNHRPLHPTLKKSKQLFSFDVNRLELDRKEKCFEECRAKSKCYKLLKFHQKNINQQSRHCGTGSKNGKTQGDKNLRRKRKITNCSTNNILDTKRRKRRSAEYVSLHEKNITTALMKITRRALKESKETNLKQNVVLNRTSSALPLGLKRDYKRHVKVNIQGQDILVKNKLGSGAYGIVILCSTLSLPDENIALKIQKEPKSLAWEYEILEKLKNRTRDIRSNKISTSHSEVFPSPLTFTLFSDGATMGMTAASGTGFNILDIVNAHNRSVPEILAIYYTSRMLKHIKMLHFTAKILHCDIKPDNWVVTTPSCNTKFSGNLRSTSDVMLVDFGRAVDIMELSNDCLYGNVAAKDLECVAMRCGDSWSYDVDTYGICVCAYILLHGSYLEIIKDPISHHWKPKKSLRRYWQKDLWNKLFNSFLNMNAPINLSDYACLLKEIQVAFDTFLQDEKNKSQLVMMLTRQERLLPLKKV